MGVSCCQQGGEGLFNLYGGHAYTLLDAFELYKDGQPQEKLLKIRNPWGSEYFSGSWSDASELWTEDLKKQVILKFFKSSA